MIVPIRRSNIFRTSPFADNLIASFQRSYASSLDASVPAEAKLLRQYYDHRIPIQKATEPLEHEIILAYDAEDIADYTLQLPQLLQHFLASLAIEQLYLLDFLRTDLNEFPFENYRKKNLFKRIAGKHDHDYAYTLSLPDLGRILPLFFNSRKFDIPIILLVTARGQVPLGIDLCDDGNLHLSYHPQHAKQLEQAAEATGFDVGGFGMCSDYSVSYLRNS